MSKGLKKKHVVEKERIQEEKYNYIAEVEALNVNMKARTSKRGIQFNFVTFFVQMIDFLNRTNDN